MTITKEEIGGRIKDALRAAGITQRALSKSLSVGESAVSAYVQGAAEPSASGFSIIAKLCNITTDWLITGKGPGPGEIKGHDYTNETPSDHEPSTINTNRLKQVVLMLEWYLAETKTKEIDPELRAEITVKMYDFYTDSNEEVSEQSFRRLMRLAI